MATRQEQRRAQREAAAQRREDEAIEDARDDNEFVAGGIAGVSTIPVHLMNDAEFAAFVAQQKTLNPNMTDARANELRQEALDDEDLLNDNGILNVAAQQAARAEYDEDAQRPKLAGQIRRQQREERAEAAAENRRNEAIENVQFVELGQRVPLHLMNPEEFQDYVAQQQAINPQMTQARAEQLLMNAYDEEGLLTRNSEGQIVIDVEEITQERAEFDRPKPNNTRAAAQARINESRAERMVDNSIEEANEKMKFVAGASNIPVHLMDDAQFESFVKLHKDQLVPTMTDERANYLRNEAIVEAGFGTKNANGTYTIDQARLNQARADFVPGEPTRLQQRLQPQQPTGGEGVEVSQIPLHLMTDDEFRDYLQQQAVFDPNFDMAQLMDQRMQAQIDNGIGSIDSNGSFTVDQEKFRLARERFDAQLTAQNGNNTPPPPTTDQNTDNQSGIGGLFAGIQEFIKGIQEFIQQIITAIGGNGGMFGSKARAATTTPTQQSQTSTNTPTPQPSQPQLTPQQQREATLTQQHSGYQQGTLQAITDGSLSFAALDTSKVDWDRDEIIKGDADLERVYNDNIAAGLDGGTGGLLHIDEDEGLLYINKDANGDITAYRVNDHINDIPNLNDLPMSSYSIQGFGNAMKVNDLHTSGFNAQTGMIKTVAFEDGWMDGKDLKNEELQFHVQVDGQGRYSVSVINDNYQQTNDPQLNSAAGQTLQAVLQEDPGFDYYAQGKDPIKEGLFDPAQGNNKWGNAVAKGIQDAGGIIERSIQNGVHIHVGDGNPQIRMGNYNNGPTVQDRYNQLSQEAEASARVKGIDLGGGN